MNNEMIEIVRKTLQITDEEIMKNHKEVPEIKAHYFWDSKRGGKCMIINEAGEKLAAGSAISFQKLVDAFVSGRRN